MIKRSSHAGTVVGCAVIRRIPMRIDASPVGPVGGIEEVNRGTGIVPSVIDQLGGRTVEGILDLVHITVGEIHHHLDYVLPRLHDDAVVLRLGQSESPRAEGPAAK